MTFFWMALSCIRMISGRFEAAFADRLVISFCCRSFQGVSTTLIFTLGWSTAYIFAASFIAKMLNVGSQHQTVRVTGAFGSAAAAAVSALPPAKARDETTKRSANTTHMVFFIPFPPCVSRTSLLLFLQLHDRPGMKRTKGTEILKTLISTTSFSTNVPSPFLDMVY